MKSRVHNSRIEQIPQHLFSIYIEMRVDLTAKTGSFKAATVEPIFEEQDAALTRLTERERQVLLLCLNGLSVKELAWHLRCAQSTASTHKTNVMRKLGITSDIELGRAFAVCCRPGLCLKLAGINTVSRQEDVKAA